MKKDIKISNRDILLLYIYDLAKVDVNTEPWYEKRLPRDAEIRQVEAREVLNRYGRTSNPGSVHKILSSRYFKRLGDNPRSPYVPSSEGWSIVQYYLNMNLNGKTIRDIWKESNVEDGGLKEYKDRYLLLDIVMDSLSPQSKEESEEEQVPREEGKNAEEIEMKESKTSQDSDLEDTTYEESFSSEENDESEDMFVDYMLLGSKYMELGLMKEAYLMFEKALEENDLLLSIPRDMSVILGKEGFYREALRKREEYWKRFDRSLLQDKIELEEYLNGNIKKSAEKARYAVLEGDISSCVKYFEELADELEKTDFSSSERMSQLAKKYARELKKIL